MSARERPIHKGFRRGFRGMPYPRGVQGACLERLYPRKFGYIPLRIRSLQSSQKPLRRSRRRGAAWREQGLDCSSAASFQARRQATRDKGFSAPWGRVSLLTFFGEAKKVSGVRCRTAQRHQKKSHEWKSARRLWQFLYLKCLRVPALKSFIRAGFGASPRQRRIGKTRGRKRRCISKKRWPEARVFRASPRGMP